MILLLVAFWFFFMRQQMGGNNKVMNFGKAHARTVTDDKNRVTFAQVAGADEEKKKIIAEIFRRLAVDVKDELKKAAGEGLEGVKTVLTNLTKGEK